MVSMANALYLQQGPLSLLGSTSRYGQCFRERVALPQRHVYLAQVCRKVPKVRIAASFRPTDVEAGNVEWLGSVKHEEDGEENAYLNWKRERDIKEQEKLDQARQNSGSDASFIDLPSQSDFDHMRREKEFASILQVPIEERDRVQKLHVLTRAAAALAATEALLSSKPPQPVTVGSNSTPTTGSPKWVTTSTVEVKAPALQQRPLSSGDFPGGSSATSLTLGAEATPGPDFWTWVPPPDDREPGDLLLPVKADLAPPNMIPELPEKERHAETLALPLQSETEGLPPVFQSRGMPSLPPLQSLLEVQKEKVRKQELQSESSEPVPELETDTVSGVKQGMQTAGKETSGVHQDGTRWWQEKGTEFHANGVICNWTVIRGVSADGSVEWEEKFWEAADACDFKELGAEKSGRDSLGGVWREFWQESMWQDTATGLVHFQKSADKWAKNGKGGQWHEKWMEHYDASGRAEKWADKWSQIDPSTPLEPGHAHVWQERWGEEYDGQGSSMKYTDKWAERLEYGGGRTKWGDKWDERFNQQGHGIKQGETWWEGLQGERWNRTWGEGHNGTGWVHKYGKSSGGEHWDTHEQQDTWYERHPHFGFRECFDNSRELRRVGKKRRKSL